MELYKEFPNFDCQRFEEECFDSNSKNPFVKRLQNIYSWRDVREYYGLGTLKCDENNLKQGFMSKTLHDCLVGTLGEERMASYFSDKPVRPKLTKEQQDINDLATLIIGSPREIQEMRSRRGNRDFFK